ncbi:MAG: VCBS repeat-containing protein [Pirellulaceae bacterium]
MEASANISSFQIQDVDGDGLPDIVLVKINFLGTLDVLLNQGDQRYELAQSFANVTSLTGDIAIADLDGNDAPDIAVGSIDASLVPRVHFGAVQSARTL